MDQYHGWMELFFAAGGFLLGAAIAWAALRNSRRNHANDAIGNAAAQEQYKHPDSYDPDKFRAQLQPKR